LRLAPLVLAAAAFALAAPGLANATTYCVNSRGCSGTPEPDLQTALNVAQTSTGVADTVEVGNPGVPLALGYHYNGADDNPVNIIGAGTSATTLTATDGGSTVLALTGATSSLSHLTLRLPAAGSYGTQTNAGSIGDVNVTSADPGTGSQTGAYLFGHGQTWNGGSITMPPGTGTTIGLYASTPGVSVTFENLLITVQDSAMQLAQGSATMRHLRLVTGTGMSLSSENTTADDVLYRADPTAAERVMLSAGTTSTDDGTINLNHVTAVGDGSAAAFGVLASSANGKTLTVNMRNSIMRGFGTSVGRQATNSGSVANVTLSYSDIDAFARQSDLNLTGGSGSNTSGPGNIGVDPKWANPAAGDFSLVAGSPAVDAGDPAGLGAGEPTTDLLGKPRLAGARTDMGAFEFQPPPPVPPSDTTAPTMKLSRIPKKLRPKQLVTGFSFTVTPSEAATLDATLAGSARSAHLAKSYNITLAHKRTPRSAATRRITLRAKKKLVGSSRRFTVRLTLVATDAAGNKRTITRTIKVRK
jgi:hypothetical protein